jgi:hypothetical protein
MQTLRNAALAAGVVLTALAGCHSSGDAPSPPPPITSAACGDPSQTVVITDPTNYSLSDSFDIKTTTLKDNSNLMFDWSGLKTDFFGHAVNPTSDINLIMVALWHMSPSQLEDVLKTDNVPLNTMAGVITAYPVGISSVSLQQDFTLLGQPIPDGVIPMYFDTSTPGYQYPQDQYTFMMMASTGTTVGRNPRGIALFHIDPNASQTTLAMTDDSTKLSYSVDLTQAAPVLVPPGTPKLSIDWGQMTKNMIGNKYDWTQITRVAAAHFKSLTLEQLQSKFLDLQTLADDWWSTTMISGSSVDLSTLTKTDGTAFPGIDASGVWLTAMFCDDTCNNPAPWSITILQPCH